MNYIAIIGDIRAANAAILAAKMLSISDKELRGKLAKYKEELKDQVAAKDAKLGKEVWADITLVSYSIPKSSSIFAALDITGRSESLPITILTLDIFYPPLFNLAGHGMAENQVQKNIGTNYENLSVKNQMEEFMFLGLRMCKGVSKSAFMDRFGVSMDKVYGNVIKHSFLPNISFARLYICLSVGTPTCLEPSMLLEILQSVMKYTENHSKGTSLHKRVYGYIKKARPF